MLVFIFKTCLDALSCTNLIQAYDVIFAAVTASQPIYCSNLTVPPHMIFCCDIINHPRKEEASVVVSRENKLYLVLQLIFLKCVWNEGTYR